MIEFLQDYITEALPPETFQKGQRVERSAGSEGYFVGRGLTAYVIDGKLFDDHHREITEAPTIEIVRLGDRRTDLAVRAGEVMTGQPPRATSGPGVPFVETGTGTEGVPSVVLDAEIERLKDVIASLNGQLASAGDAFRDMNNSHVADKDRLDSAREAALTEAGQLRDQLAARDVELGDVRGQHATLSDEHQALRTSHDASTARIAELEEQLEAAKQQASKPAAKKA